MNDNDHPYVQEKPFDWIRGYQVGGKLAHLGTPMPTLERVDFEAPARDGVGIDWPIRYDDIAPWYYARRKVHRRQRHRTTG